MDDLETVNPSGRLDVLAYRGMQKLAEHLEQQNGLSGLWDAVKPHVNKAIAENIGRVDIPTEAKVLLMIIQANYKPNSGEPL